MWRGAADPRSWKTPASPSCRRMRLTPGATSLESPRRCGRLWCQNDDGDGICDEDECVGEFDVCGICNDGLHLQAAVK